MRNALLMSARLLCWAAAPALAQNATITTQTPPAPNAQSFTPQPGVSVPAGSATAVAPRPGDDIADTRTRPMDGTDRAMTGMRPMHGQRHHARRMHHGGGAMHHGDATAGASGDYNGDGGRVRVPTSHRATHTGARGTYGEIAPRLPDPNTASNSPEAFLAAAERAVQARQTGRAQEALERAETRLLTRSVDASMADTPASNPAVQHIGEARRALGRGDRAAALQLIQAAQANAGGGAGMGMQGAGMGMNPGMSGGQMGGMNRGMGMSGGQMGGMGHDMSGGQMGGQMGGMNQGMGMSGGQMGSMGQGMRAPGNVGSQGQSMGAQGVGAPVSGTVR